MKRRKFVTLMGLSLIATLTPICLAITITKELSETTFYVAINGDDNYSGTLAEPNRTDGPFATIERAQQAIRQLKQQQGGLLQKPVTVKIRGGTYYLEKPLLFTPEDSGTASCPITYQAYEGEQPIISGGKKISDWQQQGHLWVAKLNHVAQENCNFRLLRVGDDWAIRARYPNFDPKHPLMKGWLYVNQQQVTLKQKDSDSVTFSESSLRECIPLAAEQFPDWQNWEGAEVNIFMKHNYGNSIFAVSNVDRDRQALLGNFINANYPVGFGNRFFIENVREALDSPGEWYLDTKTGELLYWPTPEFSKQEVVAPMLEKLIVLQGNLAQQDFVAYLNFEGLTFSDTNYTLADNYFVPGDTAVEINASYSCRFSHCTFIYLGGNALKLQQGSHHNKIIHNNLQQLGQGGILLWSLNFSTQPYHNLIAANHISDCGRIYKHVAGIYVSCGSNNRIAHNHICNLPRYGISIKSVDNNHYSHHNLIEFNYICDTCLETSDAGAIETLGRDRQSSDNVIQFNFIRNVFGMGTTTDGQIISPYWTKGLYFDDYSSGITVYGNIIVNTLEHVVIHGGHNNLIENNIFINGTKSQIRLTPIGLKLMENNIIRRNIFVYDNFNAKIFSWYPPQTWQKERLKECDFNLYWHTGKLDFAKTNKSITPEGNFEQWQTTGFDLNSLIADPMFVAPQKSNFSLKSNSPAYKLGFKPIPLEKLGIKGFIDS